MQNDLFERESIPKAYFKLALPVVFSMVITLVYNMVDTYFIAQTNNTNLIAGVSLGAPIFTLMIALGDILGLGGSSLISRLFGEKKEEDAKRISVFCFYGAILLGVFVTIIMLLLKNPILNMLGADVDTFEYASQYYKYIVIGAPAIILAFTPANLLRTEGFAMNSMIGSVIGSVINIILDPIFISTLGLGAAGAAMATVIGNIFSNMYFILFLLKKSERLSIDIKLLRITFHEFKDILVIGIPASITNFMQSFGIALMNLFLLSYGNDKVAAMGIVMKINLIAVLILVGFSFGIQPLIGYNYGAKNYKRLKDALKFCYLFEGILAVFLTAALCIAAPYLMKVFVDDSSIITTGTQMLRFQLISMVFVSIVLITSCTFQATGKAFGALLLSISRQGVIFAIVIILGSRLFGYHGIILSQAIADALTALLAIGLLVKGLYPEIRNEKKHA